jgi:hypothetical protein
MVTAVALKC